MGFNYQRWIPILAFSLLAGVASLPNKRALAKNCVLFAEHILSQPPHDSAVELEIIDSQHSELALITTRDGTVGSLLLPGEKFPIWFKEWADKHQPIKKTRNVGWDDLDRATQVKLLKALSLARKHKDFFKDRKIHGLVTRKKVHLTFSKPTEFLGKHYSPGTHLVHLEGALQSHVEYSSPQAQRNFEGVELHFRTNLPAGNVSQEARKLLAAAKIPRTHQHIHAVSRLRVEQLRKDPITEGMRHGYFVLRANMAAEMLSVVFRNRPIVRKVHENTTNFGYLNAHELDLIGHEFIAAGSGKEFHIQDAFKMGWIGIRGTDTYDQPGLWGIEYRANSDTADFEREGQLLNGIQHAMEDPNLGLPPQLFEEWLNTYSHQTGHAPITLYEVSYHRSWEELIGYAEPRIKQRLTGPHNKALREHLDEASKTGAEVKMLAHDWAFDPVVFENPTVHEKIIRAQLRALDRMNPRHSEYARPNEIVQDFLIESGLFEAMMRSFNVRVETPKKPATQ